MPSILGIFLCLMFPWLNVLLLKCESQRNSSHADTKSTLQENLHGVIEGDTMGVEDSTGTIMLEEEASNELSRGVVLAKEVENSIVGGTGVAVGASSVGGRLGSVAVVGNSTTIKTVGSAFETTALVGVMTLVGTTTLVNNSTVGSTRQYINKVKVCSTMFAVMLCTLTMIPTSLLIGL